MKLEMRGDMRMEQRMKLAPHMIQSMEILQLPILALQERIEQELNSNPVLEVEESVDADERSGTDEHVDETEFDEKDMVVDNENDNVEDFNRLDSLGDSYDEYVAQAAPMPSRARQDEPDPKLEAMKNAPAPQQSLNEHLTEQWRLVEADEGVKNAGQAIIDYLDDRGFLTVQLEQLYSRDRTDFSLDDLYEAIELVQQLEPTGVGARDLKECLLIQLRQSGDDTQFEQQLVSEHMKALLENRLPEIARKMECSIEDINAAIKRLSKLDTSPGLQIGAERNHAITADVIVEEADDGDYLVRLADSDLPSLRVSDYYAGMANDTRIGDRTRKFLQHNIRSAQWIIDAIEQRRNTLLRVTRSIVRYQRDFFDKGELYLRPLPMATVADDVGVHLATVSRAVSGKYVQCDWGVLPLRKFFSGGTEDTSGEALSWEAVRAKLQQIIDSEDKRNPLSDDQIRRKLAEMGIENLARRTVAKYRKLMDIPAARFRKKY